MATCASRTIKSAHRVLEILEYFDQDRRHATVMDMSRSLNYPQSSTSELLRCLAHLGYLHYNRARRAYSPTARVALLGSWVKPSLFRGGPILSAIDEVAKFANETVALSTTSNYALQHLHVVHGSDEGAIDAHAGDELPLLHSAQGRLLLSSYRNEHVRSAVHRLNADEPDPELHVRIADVLEEFSMLRDRGWVIESDRTGVGCVSVLLPRGRQTDRLALSVLARPEVIEHRGQEILEVLLNHKSMFAYSDDEGEDMGAMAGDVIPMVPPVKITNHRRYFA